MSDDGELVLCSIREDMLPQLRIACNGEMGFVPPFYWVPRRLIDEVDETCASFLEAQAELRKLLRDPSARR